MANKSTKKKVKCVVCGKTITRVPSHIREKNYCTKKCYNASGNQYKIFATVQRYSPSNTFGY